jgi:hypothetical protein
MATGDDVNTPVIALVGFISALLFFAIIILLEVAFYWAEAQQRYEKDMSQAPLELTTLTHNQQARLAEYRWVDEKKGVVAIPIDRAMELVVADLGTKAEAAGAKGRKVEPPAGRGKRGA